jgi:PAS domain S-box-containing protein
MNLFSIPKLGIRAKLTLLIESYVVIFVLVTGYTATIREKENLDNELRKRGHALTSDLAKFMVKPLLSNDLPTLRRFVIQSMGQDYVRYVIVLDPNGKVVMHSDLSEVGQIYKDSLSVAALESNKSGYTDKHVAKNEELHCDMFMPIQVSDVRLGTVRLGYSHLAVEKEISEAHRQIFVLGILFSAGGGFFAYLLATFISSPIKQITEATKKVANGYFNIQIRVDRKDEIGALASAFNKMTEDLRKTTVSKDYFDNIIRSMHDTLIVIGTDAKIRTVNKATCELLEYREDELVGKNLDLILPQEEMDFIGENLSKRIDGPTSVNREIEYITRNGKRIPMLFSSAVLKNTEAKVEGAVCIARDVTERKEAENALRESEKMLHFLSSQLLTAQEKERKRISIELHDELGQSLLVLKLKLRSIQEGLQADQTGLKTECNEGLLYINEVIENVRRLSHDLSPSILENLGLSAAIRWLVEAFTKHTRIECSLVMMGIEDVFAEEEEITIYRMIQECLTNIGKHAQATQVSIDIREEDGCAFFRVEDNGRGFHVKEAFNIDPDRKSGMGLAALYERTRMLGGSINIRSQDGAGTRITFTAPLYHGECQT